MNRYPGSTFDDFLAEEGNLEEVSARAHKRGRAGVMKDISPNESRGSVMRQAPFWFVFD